MKGENECKVGFYAPDDTEKAARKYLDFLMEIGCDTFSADYAFLSTHDDKKDKEILRAEHRVFEKYLVAVNENVNVEKSLLWWLNEESAEMILKISEGVLCPFRTRSSRSWLDWRFYRDGRLKMKLGYYEDNGCAYLTHEEFAEFKKIESSAEIKK